MARKTGRSPAGCRAAAAPEATIRGLRKTAPAAVDLGTVRGDEIARPVEISAMGHRSYESPRRREATTGVR